MKYKVGLLSSSFEHMIKACRYKEGISYLRAVRSWTTQKDRKKFEVDGVDIPYLSYNESIFHKYEIHKHSATIIPLKEWVKVLKELVNVGAIDLTVGGVGFLVNGKELLKIEELKKVADKRIWVFFKVNSKSAKEPDVKRDLYEIMKKKVTYLGLKYATLDLDGIYFYADKERKFNLLDKINGDEDVLESFVDNFFFREVKPAGIKDIRFIKGYGNSQRDIPVLKKYKRF